jgi:hypothetical protein
MERKIDVGPNKVGGISSSSPFLVFSVRHIGMMVLVSIRVRIRDSNIDYLIIL